MTGRICYSAIKERDIWPWRAARAGVLAAGDDYQRASFGRDADDRSAVLTWNNYGVPRRIAEDHVRRGGRHVVMENAYIRRNAAGERMYLMERDGFNGRGSWPADNDDGERWRSFGVETRICKLRDGYIVVCGQMGGNYSEWSMPRSWPDDIIRRLTLSTTLPIIYRPHPRRQVPLKDVPSGVTVRDPSEPLHSLLWGAKIVIVWTSNVAIEALLVGIPVVAEGPTTILGKLAARRWGDPLIRPSQKVRRNFLDRLAWACWSEAELREGTPWRRIMGEFDG